MLWIDKGREPGSRLRIVIAQVRVDFSILTCPRRIHNPEVLYGASVHYPPNDEFTRAVILYLAVSRKVGVFDIPRSDKAAKDLRPLAQRGMGAAGLQRRNHVKAWGGRETLPGFCDCGCVFAEACPRQTKQGQQPHCEPAHNGAFAHIFSPLALG